ncbi:MAG: RrF2 family transcriptional regulator [Candidatus Omnitrophica bacterium]|nr:RrF2 family transcriptional regulator [Candidatus Omnitrophota bacterium]
MKISTRARYGTRAMLELALRYGNKPILVKDIAKSQGISRLYLEQLIVSLQRAGLIKTIRGKKGGCVLARSPDKIKLSEVISTLEGSLAPSDCVTNINFCPRANLCVTRDIWIKLYEAIMRVLNSITLEDMVRCCKEKLKSAKIPIYYI